MKRMLAWLLGLTIALTSASALAVGRITPETPANPEIRETFGAWVESTLVPYLKQNQQDKWSAKRCHEIADMVEAAGFPIADQWKDKLYREKRAHRLTDAEAFYLLVQSQFGEPWEWTVQDKGWYEELTVEAGMRADAFDCAPPSDAYGTTSQAISAAHDALCAKFGITEEQWNAYDICVTFLQERTEQGEPVYYWWVILLKDWANNPYADDFTYEYSPTTGQTELRDWRKSE